MYSLSSENNVSGKLEPARCGTVLGRIVNKDKVAMRCPFGSATKSVCGGAMAKLSGTGGDDGRQKCKCAL